jgi:hypothetical protein
LAPIPAGFLERSERFSKLANEHSTVDQRRAWLDEHGRALVQTTKLSQSMELVRRTWDPPLLNDDVVEAVTVTLGDEWHRQSATAPEDDNAI